METKGKYVGYIRVSTKGQADSGLSLEAQEEKIHAYAALYDIEVVRIEVDAGLSAKTLDRPGLSRALESMESGEVEGIIITKLDRLTRRVAHTAQLLSTYFRDGKYHLLSIQDQFNTATAAGRFVVNIMASMAEMEADVISERTKTALQVLQNKSVPLGPLPYGMTRGKIGSNGRRIVITDEFEVKVAEHIVAMRNDSKSLRAICKELEELGIKTKTGRKKWQASTVKGILDRIADESDAQPGGWVDVAREGHGDEA